MLFNSLQFGLFFLLFFPIYWLLRERLWIQNALVLAGSYLFYGAWDDRFLVLIIVSTAVDFISGYGAGGRRPAKHMLWQAAGLLTAAGVGVLVLRGSDAFWITQAVAALGLSGLVLFWTIENLVPTHHRRRAYVAVSVSINLGILGVFKYFNFFAENLQALAGGFGIELSPFTLGVVLPVGISFYTFQTISYTLDCYKGKLRPQAQLLPLAAYVAFFPQLVAGPIERGAHLLPQFLRARTVSREDLSSAIILFTWGLYKKVVIADNLANIADPVFSDPGQYQTMDLVAALIAFMFQIYCDFSGYSDMARALARALGFDILLNFRLPYFSRTPSEFWQRWHISLSSWLRDYLYIPLGGNRKGRMKTYRNLIATMLLGGLWHGAAWNFILWGAYQGILLAVYRLCNVDGWLTRNTGRALQKMVSIFVLWPAMVMFVAYGWLLFRAQSLGDIITFTQGLLAGSGGSPAHLEEVLLLIAPLIIVQCYQHWRGQLEVFDTLPTFARLNCGLFIFFGLLFLAASGGKQFLYFDF